VQVLVFNINIGMIGTASASAYDWNCNLFCYNKGVCRHGNGSFGSYAGEGNNNDLSALPAFEDEPQGARSQDGMYCTCPVGYTGLQCEIKLVTCGRDSHTCHNGSACVKERSTEGNIVFYRCECDAKESVMAAPYAEKYCQHISTIFCDNNSGNGNGFSHGTSFCTNGGKCRASSRTDEAVKHVGCDCPEGWEGAHCESKPIEKQAALATTEEVLHEMEEYLSVGEVIGIVVGLILGLCLLVYLVNHVVQTRGPAILAMMRAPFAGLRNHRGRWQQPRTPKQTRGRQRQRQQQETSAYSDAQDGNIDPITTNVGGEII